MIITHETTQASLGENMTGLLKELSRSHPAWKIGAVSAFREGSRPEGIDGLSDVIASLRLGWRLRKSKAQVNFVFCPECLWGIRLFRRRRGGPPLVAVWCGAGPKPYPVLREPGDILARALAGLDSVIRDQLRRRSLSRAGAGLTAVWIGQVGYRKGLQVALAAVAEARRDLTFLRLSVAGVPAGEPVEGVDWLGVVPPSAVADVYRHADLFFFFTRYESFGLVVIEAMTAGLPVIVSDAVPPGIVVDGRNGAVLAGHNPSDYATALKRLADPRIRAVTAARSREDAKRFSIKTAGAGYAAMAESCA